MRVFAYLDAGTGSILVQAIIGFFVAIGVVLKTFWGRITSIFKKGNKAAATAVKPTKTPE